MREFILCKFRFPLPFMHEIAIHTMHLVLLYSPFLGANQWRYVFFCPFMAINQRYGLVGLVSHPHRVDHRYASAIMCLGVLLLVDFQIILQHSWGFIRSDLLSVLLIINIWLTGLIFGLKVLDFVIDFDYFDFIRIQLGIVD